MKVDANGNPIIEEEGKKEDDNQNENTPSDDEKKGAGSNEGKGTDGKNTNTSDDDDDNGGKGSSDGSEGKGPDKEAMKAEILKEMGLDNVQLGMFEKFKKLFTGDDKDETKTADEKLAELEKRTELAELKAELMQNGVLPRYIDDAVVLMHAKKEGDKQFSVKNAITDFKTRYPEWFTSDDKNGKSSGTGSSMKAGKGSDSDGKLGLGARLAASKKPATGKKSSYWGNK